MGRFFRKKPRKNLPLLSNNSQESGLVLSSSEYELNSNKNIMEGTETFFAGSEMGLDFESTDSYDTKGQKKFSLFCMRGNQKDIFFQDQQSLYDMNPIVGNDHRLETSLRPTKQSSWYNLSSENYGASDIKVNSSSDTDGTEDYGLNHMKVNASSDTDDTSESSEGYRDSTMDVKKPNKYFTCFTQQETQQDLSSQDVLSTYKCEIIEPDVKDNLLELMKTRCTKFHEARKRESMMRFQLSLDSPNEVKEKKIKKESRKDRKARKNKNLLGPPQNVYGCDAW